MEEVKNLYTKDKALVLKGMAILLMVWHHTFRAEGFFDEYTVHFAPFTQSEVVTFAGMAKICVAFFVFISGYGLYLSLHKVQHETKEYGRWIISRLVPLILSFIFVFLIVAALIGRFDPGELQDTYLQDGKLLGGIYIFLNMMGLQDFFMTPNLNGAWWYMSAAILFIVIAPIAVLCFKKFGGAAVLIITILAPRIFTNTLLGDNHLYKYLLIYLLGMEFAHTNRMNRILSYQPFHLALPLSKLLKLLLEAAAIVFFYFLGTRLSTDQYWEINYAILPVLLILFTAEFIAAVPGIKQILMFLGFFSMDIYLVHNYTRIYFSDYLYQAKWFWMSPLYMLLFGVGAALILFLVKKMIHFDQFTKWLVSSKKE